MKVENMTSNKGNKIANQFIVTGETGTQYFQSYDSIIAAITPMVYVTAPMERHSKLANNTVYLDNYYWDYSVTTSKYRNQFLGETKKETQAKIDSGEYILTNLN